MEKMFEMLIIASVIEGKEIMAFEEMSESTSVTDNIHYK